MPPTTDTDSGLRAESVQRRHVLPKALAVGIAAGLFAAAFRLALKHGEAGRLALVARWPGPRGVAVATALGALGGGAAVWLVRRFAPESSGSGIPHVRAVMQGQATLRWRRLLPVKFLSGLFGIAGGFALGREGPTIQMGAGAGRMIAGCFRVSPEQDEGKALISAGAGAGLAAAFNAPLAGMMFVLEELQVRFTPVVFVAAFLASVSADVVARALTGNAAVFVVRGMPAPTFWELPGALVLGLLAGLLGVAFNRCLVLSLDWFDRLRGWPPFWVGAAVGAAMGLIGWLKPGLAGTGTGIVEEAIAGGIAVGWLPALLAARFGMTMASYGCGPAGGIFIPLFVLGSLGGLLFGSAGHALLPVWFPHPEIFVVLGMGSLFTAIVRAPLTGLVLMVELTGVYEFMLPLLASCLVAYGVAEAMGSAPIYETLQLRSLRRGAWSAGAAAAPRSL